MLRVDQVMADPTLLSNDELEGFQRVFNEGAVMGDTDDELDFPGLDALGMQVKTLDELELEAHLDSFELPFDC